MELQLSVRILIGPNGCQYFRNTPTLSTRIYCLTNRAFGVVFSAHLKEAMNRQVALSIIVLTWILGAITLLAQKPYNQLMKEIAPTFAALKKDLDSNSADAAVEDAGKLEKLFKQTEEFWAQYNTKDAVDHAKSAQKAFADIATKAKSNDINGAQKAYGTIGSICGDCHFSHREDTGKGFVIKP